MEKQILEMFAAVDAQDWSTYAAFYDGNIRYERPGMEPLLGIDSFMHFYRYDRRLARTAHRLDRVVAQEDAAACWGEVDGELVGGAAFYRRFAEVYLLTGGRISFRRTHFFEPGTERS
jgi:ketosteroid isomerase-like protein